MNTEACSRGVRMQLAVGAAMIVPLHPSVLRMALRDTMLAAIDAAPGGHVLITAATLGRQLHIGIIDDGPGIDQQAREISMRQTETLIALQGGSIAIEARPGRGTAVTIRLPMPVSAESEASGSMPLPVLADLDA
jgi:signal transduction histidine kinase